MENKKELILSDHLDQNFFQKILETEFKSKNIKIQEFSSNIATKPGDNYASDIYRVKIVYSVENGSNENLSFIIKSMENQEAVSASNSVIDEYGLFNKETFMFHEIIPQMSKLSNGAFFAAKCFYSSEKPFKFMVFQDLGALGYRMAERRNMLDFNHSKIVFEKIGRFHGASIALNNQQPNIFEQYNHGLFNPNSTNEADLFFDKSFASLIALVKTWPGYEIIAEKLEELYDRI